MSYLPPLSDETKQVFDFFRGCVSDNMQLPSCPKEPNAGLAWARQKTAIDIAVQLTHEMGNPTGGYSGHPSHTYNMAYFTADLVLFNLWKDLGFP